MFLRHPILSTLTVAYLALVSWLTLTPSSTGFDSGLIWRLARLLGRYPETQWFTFLRLEFIANIAMFVPLGVFLVLLFGGKFWWAAIVIGMMLTVGIEFVQQYIPGRVTDVRDLVANSLGAVVGVLLALALTAAREHRHRVATKSRLQRVTH